MGFPNWGEGGGRHGKNSHIFPFFVVADVPKESIVIGSIQHDYPRDRGEPIW